jgi:hypothetical protein
MRTAGAFIAIVGGTFAGTFIDWGVKGEVSALTAVVLAAGMASFAGLGIGYLLRYRLALGDGQLTVTGLFRTHRIPVRHVVRAYPTKYGIVFLLDNGRRIRARAVETAAYRLWLRDYTTAHEIIDEVLASADRAREGRPAAPADASVLSRIEIGQRNAVYARIAISLAASALLAFIVLNSSGSDHSSTPSNSRPVLTIGECLQDPVGTDSEAAVSCTAPHTAQVFATSRTSPGATCDRSLIISSALPQDTSDETLYLVQNGVPTTVCLIIVASITHSVVEAP